MDSESINILKWRSRLKLVDPPKRRAVITPGDGLAPVPAPELCGHYGGCTGILADMAGKRYGMQKLVRGEPHGIGVGKRTRRKFFCCALTARSIYGPS